MLLRRPLLPVEISLASLEAGQGFFLGGGGARGGGGGGVLFVLLGLVFNVCFFSINFYGFFVVFVFLFLFFLCFFFPVSIFMCFFSINFYVVFMCFFSISFYVFDSQYIYKDEDIYISKLHYGMHRCSAFHVISILLLDLFVPLLTPVS